MTAEVTQQLAEDGCYDFVHDGAIVGRLLWVPAICEEHPVRGWWLQAFGAQDELICRVPRNLATDLAVARARGVSMSLGLAEHVLTDRLEGLLDGPDGPSTTE